MRVRELASEPEDLSIAGHPLPPGEADPLGEEFEPLTLHEPATGGTGDDVSLGPSETGAGERLRRGRPASAPLLRSRAMRPGSRGGRRGRPKTARPDIDRGTDESLVKRRLLVGPDGRLDQAESPIAIMAARRILDRDEERAADIYETLYRSRHGRIHPRGFDLLLAAGIGLRADWESPGPPDSPRDARIAKAWRVAVGALTRAEKDEVENAAVFKRLPRWLWAEIGRVRRRASDSRRRGLLLSGLRALVILWSRRRPGHGERDAA